MGHSTMLLLCSINVTKQEPTLCNLGHRDLEPFYDQAYMLCGECFNTVFRLAGFRTEVG